MKSNSRYNGLTIDMINKHARTELVKVATVNGRDYYEGEKRPGYYRPVLITRDGVVKQGFWFSESEVLAKVTADDLCYFGSRFDCEPYGAAATNLEIVKA